MAQFDGSMYRGVPAVDFSSITEGMERGMKMGDMIKQRKAEQLVKEAYQAGVVKNPDGSTSFDRSVTIGQLMKADPRKAQEAELQFQQQDFAKQQNNANLLFQESTRALQSPQYYQTAVQNLIKNGVIQPNEAPPVFDENFVRSAAVRAGSAKDYLDNMLREKESSARLKQLDFDNKIKLANLGLDRDRLKQTSVEKQEKKNSAVTEVQDRYLNIKNEIANLGSLIDENGTYDVTGPQNEILDQKITSIATDMAKLVDPTSVARESEVAAFKKMLFSPTPWIRNQTAKDILGSFDKMVDDRLQTAYKVRGLEGNPAVTQKTSGDQQPSQQDVQAFQWAQQNPNDPRAKKILEQLKSRGF